jgi:hypothetical protein
MKNRIVLIATLALLGSMAGCALRFSAEIKNPWHPEAHQTAKPSTQQR